MTCLHFKTFENNCNYNDRNIILIEHVIISARIILWQYYSVDTDVVLVTTKLYFIQYSYR